MAKKEMQFKKITTPVGKSMWTKLANPETRWATPTDPAYKQGGYYEACVRFTAEESAPLRALITQLHEENLKEACENILVAHLEKFPKQKGKLKDAVKFVTEQTEIKINPLPIKQVRNEDGDMTDEWEVKAKQWARGVKKDKMGNVIEEWENIPHVRSPLNKPYDIIPKIGNGSLIKLAIELSGYQKPSIGIRIRLCATQVWELVEYNGGGGFDDSAFEANPDAPALSVVGVGVGAGSDSSEEDADDIPF
tara:strand:+ start:4253 stop:5002 length:750 start_codon:yes stop_codon:yes gene_type:complete